MADREILLTNDDGFFAPGINALAQLLREYGNVTMVAPSEVQSGASASFSMDRILRLRKTDEEDSCVENGVRLGSIRKYTFTGTPVDCAKMGVNMFREEGRMPDFLASGINHGSNASAAAIYSGTLGATREGTIYGIPSVGFSIDSHDLSSDLSAVIEYSRKVLENVFKYGISPGTFLNVNFPAVPKKQIRGFRFATQGRGRWEKEFECRTDPRGRKYYWIVGTFMDMDDEAGERFGDGSSGDHKLLEKGWISICPMKIDATDYDEISRLREAWHND